MQFLALASHYHQDTGKPPVFRLTDGVVRVDEETEGYSSEIDVRFLVSTEGRSTMWLRGLQFPFRTTPQLPSVRSGRRIKRRCNGWLSKVATASTAAAAKNGATAFGWTGGA